MMNKEIKKSKKNISSKNKKTVIVKKKEQYKKIVLAILSGLLGVGGIVLYRHKLPKGGVPETNKGFQILKKQGWIPGTPVGKSKKGITSPIKTYIQNTIGSSTVGLGYKSPN